MNQLSINQSIEQMLVTIKSKKKKVRKVGMMLETGLRLITFYSTKKRQKLIFFLKKIRFFEIKLLVFAQNIEQSY